MYALYEELLVKVANKESFSTEFEKITNFYADDFKPNALEIQLKTLPLTLPLGRNLHRCPQTSKRIVKKTETPDQ